MVPYVGSAYVGSAGNELLAAYMHMHARGWGAASSPSTMF